MSSENLNISYGTTFLNKYLLDPPRLNDSYYTKIDDSSSVFLVTHFLNANNYHPWAGL